MLRCTTLVLTVALLSSPALWAQEQTAPIVGYTETKEYVHAIDSDHPYQVTTNQDRSKLVMACQIKKNKNTRIWWGDESTEAKVIVVQSTTVSPDGSRLAWIGLDKNGNKKVFVDGEEICKCGYVFYDTVIFSPDSKQYAFAISESGQRGKKDCRVVYNGEKLDKHHSIVGPPPTFSPDSKKLVYFGRDRDDWFVVVDGVKGPTFTRTGWGPSFSPDGTRMAYAGIRPEGYYLVVNDETTGPFHELHEIKFSPVGDELFYSINYGDSACVMRDGRQYGETYRETYGFDFSPDGKHFGFSATDTNSAELMVIDSVEGHRYQDSVVSFPSFFQDGEHYYGYVLTDTGADTRGLLIDDSLVCEIRGSCDGIDVTFPSEGFGYGVAWVIDSTSEGCIVNGHEFPPREWYSKVVFSPDGQHYAVAVGINGYDESELILDGVTDRTHRVVFPGQRFTPDSRALAYVAGNGIDQYVVIGETELEHFDKVYPKTIKFEEDGSLIYYGVKSREVYRVVARPR